MGTIDTDKLKSLGPDGAGPWRTDDDKLLRIACGKRPLRTEDEAREMLAVYRASAAAASTPDGHEVVRIDGGYGVVVDYVAGLGMHTHLAFGSYSFEEAGRVIGSLLRKLHGARMELGRDWKQIFCDWTNVLAPLLPSGQGARLVSLVDAIPECHCLLHGDFHVGNMIVSGEDLTPIDMEHAGFGHPVFDLAIARSRTLGNARREARDRRLDIQAAERFAREIWDGLLESYFEGAAAGELAKIDRRIEVLCEVDKCCFGYGIEHIEPEGLNEHQQARVTLCAERLAEMLPHLERLDF